MVLIFSEWHNGAFNHMYTRIQYPKVAPSSSIQRVLLKGLGPGGKARNCRAKV
jgi:hypothetical protein